MVAGRGPDWHTAPADGGGARIIGYSGGGPIVRILTVYPWIHQDTFLARDARKMEGKAERRGKMNLGGQFSSQ